MHVLALGTIRVSITPLTKRETTAKLSNPSNGAASSLISAHDYMLLVIISSSLDKIVLPYSAFSAEKSCDESAFLNISELISFGDKQVVSIIILPR